MIESGPGSGQTVAVPVGRFAPSPTGTLHVGNLRTALVAWLCARSTGSSFVVRMEDLDPSTSRREFADGQLADLAALGLSWDGPVEFQSTRLDLYRDAIAALRAKGLVYPCWCTRREIAEASQAPNQADLPEGAYQGTCRSLSARQVRQRHETGRQPALRILSDGVRRSFVDGVRGHFEGAVDDVVLARADAMPAYNMAVVVDDDHQGVQQVVRGDDLLSSTPRQMMLAEYLGISLISYAHVPLVVNREGKRLTKRDGAVTLADLAALGRSANQLCGEFAASLGLRSVAEPTTPTELLAEFSIDRLGGEPWEFQTTNAENGTR